MTGWAERRRIADLEWRMVRQEAEEHTCNECGAPPGEHCRNVHDGTELQDQPAHWRRVKTASDHKENR